MHAYIRPEESLHAGLEKAVSRKLEGIAGAESPPLSKAKLRFKSVAQRIMVSGSMKRPSSFVNLAQLAEAAGESDAKVCVCMYTRMYVCMYALPEGSTRL